MFIKKETISDKMIENNYNKPNEDSCSKTKLKKTSLQMIEIIIDR